MTENIRNIFDTNIQLLGVMDKAVYYFREQQYEKALQYVVDSVDQINTVLESIIKDREYFNLVDTESMFMMLTGILTAQKSKDFVLLTDLLELQLISFLIGVQELIISKEEITFNEEHYKENITLLLECGVDFSDQLKEPINTTQLLENGYRIEFTSCGQMTLAAENNGSKFYFHTNNKIQSEAFLLARHWLLQNKKRYIIYGLGMGYHINELILLAQDAELEIYEGDQSVVQLACAFTDIRSLLQNERVKLIYDPELLKLKNRISEIRPEEEFVVHYPSYKNIRSLEGKKLIDDKLSWSDLVNL